MKNKVIGKLIWKSEKEQIKEVEEIKKTRDKDYGQDGKIVVAEGKFVYRGVAYLINVLRYFNYRAGFTTMGRDRISDCHAVVEYPDETRPIIDLIPNDYGSEFLYCEGEDCVISLYLLREMAEKLGIVFSEKEKELFL